jgi:hypothetical protein
MVRSLGSYPRASAESRPVRGRSDTELNGRNPVLPLKEAWRGAPSSHRFHGQRERNRLPWG